MGRGERRGTTTGLKGETRGEGGYCPFSVPQRVAGRWQMGGGGRARALGLTKLCATQVPFGAAAPRRLRFVRGAGARGRRRGVRTSLPFLSPLASTAASTLASTW